MRLRYWVLDQVCDLHLKVATGKFLHFIANWNINMYKAKLCKW